MSSVELREVDASRRRIEYDDVCFFISYMLFGESELVLWKVHAFMLRIPF